MNKSYMNSLGLKTSLINMHRRLCMDNISLDKDRVSDHVVNLINFFVFKH